MNSFILLFALLGFGKTARVDNAAAFQVAEAEAVSNYLQRCEKQNTELGCLQMIFNDDYFWAR